MKKGYHSTQRKAFNTIPYSEFLGIALGYAAGLILQGITRNTSNIIIAVCLIAGFGIGFLIDRIFYQEKDEEETEAQISDKTTQED